MKPTLNYLESMDTQWRHKSKKSENLGQCGRQNMLRPYLQIWDWELIFSCAVKVISSLGIPSPCTMPRPFMDCNWNSAKRLLEEPPSLPLEWYVNNVPMYIYQRRGFLEQKCSSFVQCFCHIQFRGIQLGEPHHEKTVLKYNCHF